MTCPECFSENVEEVDADRANDVLLECQDCYFVWWESEVGEGGYEVW